MCGLVGVISKNKHGLFTQDLNIFEDMLYMDALRGEDATGVCLVTKEQGAKVIKEASPSSYFMWTKQYNAERAKFCSEGVALLGHNRKATMGKTGEDKNAHPFVLKDRYVFFHNGTLHNHKNLHDTEVDSEALGMVLTECEGHKEKLEESLGKVFGAFACVWYDSVKNDIYFIRNSQRPLHIIQLTTGDYVYSSELAIGVAAIHRRGGKVKENLELKEHVLYTLNLDKFELTQEELSPKKATPQVTHFSQKPAVTSACEGLSKNALKRIKKKFLKSNYVTFDVEDMVPSVDNPAANDCVDWYVFGTCSEEPNVVIHGLLKNKFEYDILPMFHKLGTGVVYDVEVRDNKVDVYLQGLQFHTKRKLAHVH